MMWTARMRRAGKRIAAPPVEAVLAVRLLARQLSHVCLTGPAVTGCGAIGRSHPVSHLVRSDPRRRLDVSRLGRDGEIR